ncbi:MAG: hypothetical protein AAB881_01360 [Patescibacteria group bacterium]
MNHQDLYKLLQTVQKNIRCPQCGQSYDFDSISIRGIIDSIVFLELACETHMPVLATVSLDQNQKIGPVSKEKIGSDDVLKTHEFLKDFAGNFEQIFKQ